MSEDARVRYCEELKKLYGQEAIFFDKLRRRKRSENLTGEASKKIRIPADTSDGRLDSHGQDELVPEDVFMEVFNELHRNGPKSSPFAQFLDQMIADSSNKGGGSSNKGGGSSNKGGKRRTFKKPKRHRPFFKY
jgi:hypothetical protein